MEFVLSALGVAITIIGVAVAYAQLRRTPKVRDIAAPEVQTPTPHSPPILATERLRHNLPGRGVLIGRTGDLGRSFAGLASAHATISIEGLGGVGKTSMAREIGWSIVTQAYGSTPLPVQFEAVIWAEDTEGNLTVDRLLNTVSDVLEYPYIRTMPSGVKATEVIRKLQTHACLIIVDNLETVTDKDVYDFLNRVPPPSRVLITSREHSMRSAWIVDLKALNDEDGFALLKSEALRLGVSPERMRDKHLPRLYDATGGNPLAIRFVVGQMKVGASLLDVLDDLANAQGEEVFSAIFDRIWNKILEPNIEARLSLLALSILPDATTQSAIDAATGLSPRSVRAAIQILANLSLADVIDKNHRAGPQFRLHPLTRAFANQRLLRDRSLQSRMTNRLADYYVVFADEHRDTYAQSENTYELDSQRINLLFSARYAFEQAEQSDDDELWARVLRFADVLGPYLWGRGLWAERVRLCERAINAARRLNDGVAMAQQWATIGRVNLWLGNVDMAMTCLAQSQAALPDDVTDLGGALTKRLRAQIATTTSDLDVAEGLLLEILDIAPHSPDDQGRAATLVELGQIAAKRGDAGTAYGRYAEALALDESVGSIEGQALSLSHLGDAQIDLGSYTAAQASFQRGLDLSVLVGRLSAQARCEYGLARVFATEHDPRQAILYARRAERTFLKLGLDKFATAASSLADAEATGASMEPP